MESERGHDPARRKLLVGLAATVAVPMLNLGRFRVFAASDEAYSKRTIELLERALVIDMLNPIGMMGGRLGRWMSDPAAFSDEDFAWLESSPETWFHAFGPEVSFAFLAARVLISLLATYLLVVTCTRLYLHWFGNLVVDP